MEGVNGGESGNQPPPVRRLSRAAAQPRAQGNPNAARTTNQEHPDPRTTRPRNPAPPRQPRPGQHIPAGAIQVHAHEDGDYGYGQGYGNTYNDQQGHVQPHHKANRNSRENRGYQYAVDNHYVNGSIPEYQHGNGASHQAEAYDGAAYNGAHGVAESYGQENGGSSGYGVRGMNRRGGEHQAVGEEQHHQAVGEDEHQPSEKCMQCVHGIGVPIATVATRVCFKGARCIACCTIL